MWSPTSKVLLVCHSVSNANPSFCATPRAGRRKEKREEFSWFLCACMPVHISYVCAQLYMSFMCARMPVHISYICVRASVYLDDFFWYLCFSVLGAESCGLVKLAGGMIKIMPGFFL